MPLRPSMESDEHGQQLEGVFGGRWRLTRGREGEQQNEVKSQVARHRGGEDPK